jgi:hypothetical protein
VSFQSYQAVRQQFIDHWEETGEADNQAAAYEIIITQPEVNEGDTYWACIGAYHLLPDENAGKHNLYLEAIDENNNRIFGAAFQWGWEGQRPDEIANDVIDDKPPYELANLVLWANQIIWAKIRDGLPSGTIQKIRSTHPDEAPGNTWGHHSFYTAFKRVKGDDGGGVEPPEPPPEYEEIVKLVNSALDKIKHAEDDLAAAKDKLAAVEDELADAKEDLNEILNGIDEM